MFWSVIGASWFWFLGAAIMAQLPVFTRDVLLANDAVANSFIGLFTIGIGAGSLLTNCAAQGRGLAALRAHRLDHDDGVPARSLFRGGRCPCGDGRAARMPASPPSSATGRAGASGSTCSSSPSSAGSMRCRSTPSCSTARYPSRRSRVIAANNVMNAIFMIASALAGAVLLKVMSAQAFFLLLGLCQCRGLDLRRPPADAGTDRLHRPLPLPPVLPRRGEGPGELHARRGARR